MRPVRTSLTLTAGVVLMLAVSTSALPVPCKAQTLDTQQRVAVPTSAAQTQRPSLPADTASSVVAAVRSVSPRAEVGLLVWDRHSGTEWAGTGADTRHQSASLVKLLVAIAAERGRADPARITRMLRESNDNTASLLWEEHGGDGLPAAVAASLGIAGVRPPDIPGRWGNVALSAADVVAVYRHLLAESPGLVDPLRDAPRYAADGFDQHFGIPSAFPRPWAVKQAWGTSASATTAHTTAVLGPDDRHVVALLTSHPRGTGFPVATNAATAGAEALAAVWTTG